ncbi:MAG: hypothetical protein ISR44_01010 [Rhodospirillales bacterium]|nr:hypothetical protein [Rhodospirillales bacterium]
MHCHRNPGAIVHFSGRRKERLDEIKRHTIQSNAKQYYTDAMLDDDGIMALFHGGVSEGSWTYQKYHSIEEATALAERFIGPVLAHSHTATAWQITARHTLDHEREKIVAAIQREFDLPWPDGESVGLAREATNAYLGTFTNA